MIEFKISRSPYKENAWMMDVGKGTNFGNISMDEVILEIKERMEQEEK